jgi:hypothetical protein
MAKFRRNMIVYDTRDEHFFRYGRIAHVLENNNYRVITGYGYSTIPEEYLHLVEDYQGRWEYFSGKERFHRMPSLRRLKQQAQRRFPSIWKKSPKTIWGEPCDLDYEQIRDVRYEIRTKGEVIRPPKSKKSIWQAKKLDNITLIQYNGASYPDEIIGDGWRIAFGLHSGVVKIVKGTVQDVRAGIVIILLSVTN